jgi:hypothetical protein
MDTTSHAFQWTEMQVPGENNATACWVFNDHCIYVIGNYVHIYDGASWHGVTLLSDDPMTGGNLNGNLGNTPIFAFDTNDYWLTNGLVDHYGGNTRVHTFRYELKGAPLRQAWGTSSGDMFFVGDSGTIMHFDGSSWLTYPKVTDRNLYSVWGTSHNDVWAA